MLRKPWTIQLIQNNWGLLDFPSILKLRSSLRDIEQNKINPGKAICLKPHGLDGEELWLRLETSDFYTLKEILSSGVYGHLLKSVHSAEFIIDLGANIGIASRLFSAHYPVSKILAVEADAGNFVVLQNNVSRLIAARRCIAINNAVWSKEQLLSVGPVPHGTSFSRIKVSEAQMAEGQIVQAVTMNRLVEISGFPRIDILKVDIEGAEVELFRGNLDWLDSVKAIAIEFHNDSRDESGFDRIMDTRKFTVIQADEHTVTCIKK
jgi:FkbM family methyltransferase